MINPDDCGYFYKERCTDVYLGILGGFCPFKSINECPVHNPEKTEDDLNNAIRSMFWGEIRRPSKYKGVKNERRN